MPYRSTAGASRHGLQHDSHRRCRSSTGLQHRLVATPVVPSHHSSGHCRDAAVAVHSQQRLAVSLVVVAASRRSPDCCSSISTVAGPCNSSASPRRALPLQHPDGRRTFAAAAPHRIVGGLRSILTVTGPLQHPRCHRTVAAATLTLPLASSDGAPSQPPSKRHRSSRSVPACGISLDGLTAAHDTVITGGAPALARGCSTWVDVCIKPWWRWLVVAATGCSHSAATTAAWLQHAMAVASACSDSYDSDMVVHVEGKRQRDKGMRGWD